MVNITIKLDADVAKKDLKALQRRANDLRPVFVDYLEFQKTTIADDSWGTKGANMGKKWEGLNASYRKWKGTQNTPAGAGANLRLTDKLYQAARGGDGWFQKVGKKSMAFGIKRTIIPYANRHQEGNDMPQRPYLYTAQGGLNKKSILFLKDRLAKHFKV